MIAYTDAELIAVARVVWPNNPYRTKDYLAQNFNDRKFWLDRAHLALSSTPHPHRVADLEEFCVRLALAHPAKAGEALGPGWSVQRGKGGVRGFVWSDEPTREYRRSVRAWKAHTGRIVTMACVPVQRADEDLPPEFDAALSRARLIAAAWQRIEAKAKEA